MPRCYCGCLSLSRSCLWSRAGAGAGAGPGGGELGSCLRWGDSRDTDTGDTVLLRLLTRVLEIILLLHSKVPAM